MEKNPSMEILNYDSEKHVFIKSISNLSDLLIKIRELNWDFEDKNSQFDLKFMKSVDALFGDKEKSKNPKKMKSNEDADLIKIIYNSLHKPEENQFKCNIIFNEEDPKSLRIDYYCLTSIGNIIMYILKYIIKENNFPQLLNEVFDNNFMMIMDIQFWGKSLIQFKNIFNEIENLNFCLSGPHDDDIDLKYTILFSYFYKVLFPKVKNVTINLNQTRINNIYNVDKNPYKIKEADVIGFCKKFEKLFLSNLIITNLIANTENLRALRILMSESFINEINYIFDKEFEKSQFREMISKKTSLLYFRKLMMIKSISRLSLTINSLDVFLFKDAINLIGLHQGAEKLELELFSDPKYFNLRKIYLNYLNSQEFHEIDPNIVGKYQIIMYPYIESLDDNIMCPLVEEEKIPDLLFPEFKKNLNKLKLILSEKEFVKNFKYFYLDITPYEELLKYDKYNIEILLFIFVILSALEQSTLMKTIQLKCVNINYTTVLQIRKNINKLTNNKLINLRNFKELEMLNLNMPGISLFVDFNNLPVTNLKKLNIDISTLKDMESLNEGLKNQKNELVKLLEIKIILSFNNDEKIFEEFLKIYDYIPASIESFKLTIENTLGKNELLKIMKGIHKNININSDKNKYFSLHCYSKELEAYLNDGKIKNLKEFFKSNNAYFVNKCKFNPEQNRRLSFSLIKWPELDLMKSIMLSFNKKLEKSEEIKNNKNIFSNIFNFIGKSQDFWVSLY